MEMIADELGITTTDVKRKIEFLEQNGFIHRIENSPQKYCDSCSGCASCGTCKGKNAFKNMGIIWEFAWK